jgi:hypothetical protein
MNKLKCTAANERFHASGGVFPQTVLWDFGSASPARTFVKPRLREAATPLCAIGERQSEGKNVEISTEIEIEVKAKKCTFAP